jgi:hypothetical protein
MIAEELFGNCYNFNPVRQCSGSGSGLDLDTVGPWIMICNPDPDPDVPQK